MSNVPTRYDPKADSAIMDQLVFVYGTLKRGEPNHHVLQPQTGDGPDDPAGKAEFVSRGRTRAKFPLVIATRYNIPHLLDRPGLGFHVEGEVYRVDEAMLQILDAFEDTPNYYQRCSEEILVGPDDDDDDNNETPTRCWVYKVCEFGEGILNLPHLQSYSVNTAELKYCERSYRPDCGKSFVEIVREDLGCSAENRTD